MIGLRLAQAVCQLSKIKRVSYRPLKSDGWRILVERLWPRSLKKKGAVFEEWAKELCTSERLKNWFDNEPNYWEPFRKKYRIELAQNELINDFGERYKDKKTITLLYATTYDKLPHPIVLKASLENFYCDI